MKRYLLSLLPVCILLISMSGLIAVVFAICALMCCSDCIAVLAYTVPASAFSAGLSAFEYIKRAGFLHHLVSIPISAQRYLLWHGLGFVASASFSIVVAIVTIRVVIKLQKYRTATQSVDEEQVTATVSVKTKGNEKEMYT